MLCKPQWSDTKATQLLFAARDLHPCDQDTQFGAGGAHTVPCCSNGFHSPLAGNILALHLQVPNPWLKTSAYLHFPHWKCSWKAKSTHFTLRISSRSQPDSFQAQMPTPSSVKELMYELTWFFNTTAAFQSSYCWTRHRIQLSRAPCCWEAGISEISPRYAWHWVAIPLWHSLFSPIPHPLSS